MINFQSEPCPCGPRPGHLASSFLLQLEAELLRSASNRRGAVSVQPSGSAGGYTSITMEVYKDETSEILRRFRTHRLTFPQCIAAMDAALTGIMPKLTDEQIHSVREIILANNEAVTTEMERRGPQRSRPVTYPNA